MEEAPNDETRFPFLRQFNFSSWNQDPAKEIEELKKYTPPYQTLATSRYTQYSYSLTPTIEDFCRLGDENNVCEWIAKNNINEKLAFGANLLHIAAAAGHMDLVKLIIKAGSKINERDNGGDTPLQLASFNGHIDIVKLLINERANILDKDNGKYTSLLTAAANGHLNIVKFLMEEGLSIHDKNMHGHNALMLAACDGHSNLVAFLINAGLNVNEKDNNGRTALSLASLHPEVVKILIEHGANVNEKYPLHIACTFNKPSTAQLLIDAKSDVNAKDEDGRTPLHLTSHVEIGKSLIEAKANVDAKDNDGVGVMARNKYDGNLPDLLIESKCSLNFNDTEINLMNAVWGIDRIGNRDLSYVKQQLETNSSYRNRIFAFCGNSDLEFFSTRRPPNIGFVNFIRACKNPHNIWATQAGLEWKIICLVLFHLSRIPSGFLQEHAQLDRLGLRNVYDVPFGIEILMETTYQHLIHQRKIKGREIYNTRSLYDSEFATTAVRDVCGKRICEILYR